MNLLFMIHGYPPAIIRPRDRIAYLGGRKRTVGPGSEVGPTNEGGLGNPLMKIGRLVMDLHELAPVGGRPTSGRDRRWLERFATLHGATRGSGSSGSAPAP